MWLEAILGGGVGRGDVGVGIEVEVRGIGLRSVLKQQVRTRDSFAVANFYFLNYDCPVLGYKSHKKQ